MSPATDVLIVGAGPTGLTLACELLRHGVSCRIIDALDAPVVWSKAAVVHVRTMEVFDDMGVAPEIVAHSKVVHGFNAYAEGKRVAHVAFAGLESRYGCPHGVSQRDTELALAKRLGELGGTVERGKRLDSFTMDDDGVRAIVERAGAPSETIEAKWLVGCDGAHSAVRKKLGFTFEGSAYEEHLIQADVRIDWPQNTDDDEIIAFLHPDGPIAAFPLFKDGRYRVIAFFLAGAPDLEPTVESIQRLLDERGARGARVSDPAWTVAFRIHCRRTDRYRSGRALIAGDAAHVHSPAGGQGMNTGIQDAYNLGWKLALVLRGKAGESLIDSYEAERQPIAKALLSRTDSATRGMTRMVGLRHAVAVGLRNQVMSLVTSIDAFQSRLTYSLSMLDLDYRESPIVRQDRASLWQSNVASSTASELPSLTDWAAFGDGPAAGDRAEDVPFEPPLDGHERLFDLLRGTRHVLFLFDGAAATEQGYDNLTAIATRVTERYAGLVDVHVVVPGATTPEALRWGGSILHDTDGAIHKRYGARSECLYLVRPDAYVGYRNQPAEGDRLMAYLATLLTA